MPEIVSTNPKTENKVAIYSSRNLFKYGIGRLAIGYNIVKESAAEFWVGHEAVRIATPEEIADAYGRSTS